MARLWDGALCSHKEQAGSLVHKASESYSVRAEARAAWSCVLKNQNILFPHVYVIDLSYTSQLDLGQLGDRSVSGTAGAQVGPGEKGTLDLS